MMYSSVVKDMFKLSRRPSVINYTDGTSVINTVFTKIKVDYTHLEVPLCINDLMHHLTPLEYNTLKKAIDSKVTTYVIWPVYAIMTIASKLSTGLPIWKLACYEAIKESRLTTFDNITAEREKYIVGPGLIIDAETRKVLYYTTMEYQYDHKFRNFRTNKYYRICYFNSEIFKSSNVVCKTLNAVACGLLAEKDKDKCGDFVIKTNIVDNDKMNEFVFLGDGHIDIDFSQCRIPELYES